MKDKIYQIALSFLTDIGAVTARKLVAYCGGADEVFKKSNTQLLKIPGIGKHRASFKNRDQALHQAEKELEIIDQNKLNVHFFLDENYPQRLKPHLDSPIIFYSRGSANLDDDRMLAVVGTRKPSSYGKAKCRQLIEDLANQNVTIVSGLAYGIDAIAHKSAVENNIKTIAVLGNGFPGIYPTAHNRLADEIVEKGGTVISQFPCFSGPDREHFPMRNRTVAYMTDGTLVIESKASGGSMITANFAFHNHKELFALPGRTIDKSSEGCNKLIKANMAQLITSGSDIIRAMFWDVDKKNTTQSRLPLGLTEIEELLIKRIMERPEIHIDDLASSTQLNNSELATALLQLELNGVIKQAAGKRYILIR